MECKKKKFRILVEFYSLYSSILLPPWPPGGSIMLYSHTDTNEEEQNNCCKSLSQILRFYSFFVEGKITYDLEYSRIICLKV